MLKLPHPYIVDWVAAIRRHLIGTRQVTVASTAVSYTIFRPEGEAADLGDCYGVCYGEDGTIYIPETLLTLDPRYAELIALHEHLEVRHKLAGRSHAYAHRRAWQEEVLAAKQVFDEPSEFLRYLRWRIGLYPEWKVPDPEEVTAQFARMLAADKPRKGELLQLIKVHRL